MKTSKQDFMRPGNFEIGLPVRPDGDFNATFQAEGNDTLMLIDGKTHRLTDKALRDHKRKVDLIYKQKRLGERDGE